MPEFTREQRMASLALGRAIQVLNEIHLYGYAGAQETLAGLSEDELYHIFDVLLDGTQVVLAARKALKTGTKVQDCDDVGRTGSLHSPHTWSYRGQEYRCRGE